MTPSVTPQEFYNKTVSHLRKQGCRSEANKGCAYRGPEGTMCAAGVHIPDELYDPEMEGATLDLLLVHFPQLEECFPDFELAFELQRIHDCVPPMNWESALAHTAAEFNLIYTPPGN